MLPVKGNRVSPGSPLKLYDYMKHSKFIIVQQGMLGYCDEVERYGKGVCVDFKDPSEVAAILGNVDFNMSILTEPREFSWNARMKTWFEAFVMICEN